MTALSFETIAFAVGEDGIGKLALNRPERMNSFTRQMAREIRTVWNLVRDDPAVRVVVLHGAEGRAFCTGVDVAELWPFPEGRPFDMDDPGEWLGPKSNKCWKPVIAAVHGLAAGGAFYFLNESDIIICSEDAQFFDPHVSFGLVAAVARPSQKPPMGWPNAFAPAAVVTVSPKRPSSPRSHTSSSELGCSERE